MNLYYELLQYPVFSIVFLTERMAYDKVSYIIIYIGYTKKNIEKDIVENGNLISG